MVASRFSLPYVILAALVAFAVFAFLFSMMHEFVATIFMLDIWAEGGEHAQTGRGHAENLWLYAPLAIPAGYAMKVIVTSRRGGP